MQEFTKLAVNNLDQFIYGRAPKPLTTKSGMIIGGGTVYPELNFTLPPMDIAFETMPIVREQYTGMIEEACKRAVDLQAPGLVVEFELLPPMTMNPEWGADIVAILRKTVDKYAQSDGLKAALRITPNDIRDHERPPYMRQGHLWDKMLKSFDLCCKAGADFISIESTGGKEVNDDAIVNADMQGVAFSLGVLCPRDMANLWKHIVQICKDNDVVPAGDTACGFGNTSMVLAEIGYIPRVWAATIRVMTVIRSLVAFEQGAIGPSKDCAYEGPYLKAITGYPISMEGSEASCAHLSTVGNISRVVADLWSNESVQNIKLLGGMAPTVSVEQLIYATRLMNVASSHGEASARTLRDWFVESDAKLDPQAYVLKPDVVLKLSEAILTETTPYKRTRKAAIATLEELKNAQAEGKVDINPREMSWLNRLTDDAEDLPEEEDGIISDILPTIDKEKVILSEYDIKA